MQIGGYSSKDKTDFTLENFTNDFKPGATARSDSLKSDHTLYKGSDPFTFASEDEYANIPPCTTSGPRYISR